MALPEDFCRRNHRFLQDHLERSGKLAVIILDADLSISGCNGCFADLFKESLIGKPLQSLLSTESRDIFPLDEGSDGIKAFLCFDQGATEDIILDCMIYRSADGSVILGSIVTREHEGFYREVTQLANEMTNLSRDLRRKNRELIESQARVKTLSGIIPICMHCKEIRNDEGYWTNLEKFISEHSEAAFSHSICRSCAEKYYPEMLPDGE